jgi:glucose/arabinose dehydrogenase
VKRILIVAALLAVAGSSILARQQNVPFKGGIPVAPTGLAGKPLPTLPVEYDTGEGMRIKVTAVATGLGYPFSIAFLPGNVMLVTTREGDMRVIRNGVLEPQPLAGLPKGYFAGQSGLPGAVHAYMDVVLHPQFAQNKYVYLSYTKSLDAKRQTVALARGTWDGKTIVGMKDIFVAGEGAGGVARVAFDRTNHVYMTTGGGATQDLNSLQGKVVRLMDDGTVPKDNPFVGRSDARPEVFTYGHRNSLGLALNPATGEIWQTENGPNGGDEMNVLVAGKNYGWPKVSYGRDYKGPWQTEVPGHVGFEPPIVYWVPAIATSGLTFYTGNKLSKWKGDVFVGSMRTGEIPGTGHVERVLFNEKFEELRRERLLDDLRQRVRDIRMGPDELLYLVTDEKPGAVLRIEPAATQPSTR